MSSIHTNHHEDAQNKASNLDKYIPVKLAQAIANPLFPNIDNLLRSGRHIGFDDLDNHAFLNDYQTELEQFYSRYNVELIRAPEQFFYLRPKSTTLIARSVLSELDMLVGKVLCYMYLSPERLAHEGIFTFQELYEELLSLADEVKLLKIVNQRSTGSDYDRQKLYEKVKTSLNRLKKLGMVYFIVNNDSQKFRIHEAIFRFGADVRISDNMQQAQLKLIRDGEAMMLDASSKKEQSPADSSDEASVDDVSVQELEESL